MKLIALMVFVLPVMFMVYTGKSQPYISPTDKRDAALVWMPQYKAGCNEFYETHIFYRQKGYFEIYCSESDYNVMGSGEHCLAEIARAKKDHPYKTIGIVGDMFGGAEALVCLSKAEKLYPTTKFAAVVSRPAHGFKYRYWEEAYETIRSPTFQIYGVDDTFVTKYWVHDGYEVIGGDKHIYGAVGTDKKTPLLWLEDAFMFFDWKLMGSLEAKDAFLKLPETSHWEALPEDISRIF